MASPSPGICFRQLRHDDCLSYFLGDPRSRQALLIDPCVELMSDYRTLLAPGWKLEWVIDTHLHSDHFSASHLLRHEYGAGIAMGEGTSSARPTLRLKAGEVLRAGDIALQAVPAPGHTADSICLRDDVRLFTGDALWCGELSVPDPTDGDPAAHWRTLGETLFTLPAGLCVFPAHDRAQVLFSTVGNEARKNAHWRLGAAELLALQQARRPASVSEEMQRRLGFNRAAAPTDSAWRGPGSDSPGEAIELELLPLSALSVSKFAKKLQRREADALYLDLREPEEFAAGHIAGCANLPVHELHLRLEDLRKARKIYLYALSDNRGDARALQAARTLAYLGYPDVVSLEGGYRAWVNQGYPVEKQ